MPLASAWPATRWVAPLSKATQRPSALRARATLGASAESGGRPDARRVTISVPPVATVWAKRSRPLLKSRAPAARSVALLEKTTRPPSALITGERELAFAAVRAAPAAWLTREVFCETRSNRKTSQ